MISTTQKKTILNKILESKEFINSKKNQKLLTYLINASIEHVIPTEFDIASKIFNRDVGFDPSSDTIVRVSMHNLRIKLDQYYANEGKKEKVHIVIDKGHYELRFIENYRAPRKKSMNPNRIPFLINLFLLLIIICLTYYMVFIKTQTTSDSQKIRSRSLWKEIIASERKKLFVVGDEFFFIENEGEEQTIIRKHNVNTFDDFDQYNRIHSSSTNRRKTPYPYFPRMDVWSLGYITNLFPFGIPINFKASSKFTSADILKDDIVFIGSFRSLYLFNEIINDLHIDYKISPKNHKSLTIASADTSIALSFEGESSIKHTDYCFLRKLPGPSNNTIIMILSGFYIGLAGVTDIITEESKLKELEIQIIDKLGYLPQYYNILFKSFGHSRTEFKTEVIHIEAFDPDKIMW